MITELYDAFREAGVSDDKAKAVAAAVIGLEQAATKTDLAELKVELIGYRPASSSARSALPSAVSPR